MKKEVKYIMQGFFLFLLLFAIVVIIDHVLSAPPRSVPDTAVVPAASTAPAPAPEPVKAVAGTKGKELFQMNCAACHSVHKDLTGPALGGVEKRITDSKLLYDFIRNSEAVIAAGNEYFKSLKGKYNNMPMTPYTHLSDEEIGAILGYIKEAATVPPAPPTAVILR